MLVGVASLPPSFPASQNIGILHHKKAKLRKHMRQSVYYRILIQASELHGFFIVYKVCQGPLVHG